MGASYAGKRSMTATSGPGLALMAEMIGMSTMAELPALIVDVQRGGPSTGLPTKHEQSDLFLAIHGGHGDSPRIVLSVEDVNDCVNMTVAALNLTEQYQCPVIMLSDGSLAFSTQTIPTPDPDSFEIVERTRWDGEGEYMRYKMTESLISPMADPAHWVPSTWPPAWSTSRAARPVSLRSPMKPTPVNASTRSRRL